MLSRESKLCNRRSNLKTEDIEGEKGRREARAERHKRLKRRTNVQ